MEKLPVDLLCIVTRDLHYLDIANLWFSGSTSLNARLARGGVAKLSVSVSSKLRRFAWPHLFGQLTRVSHFEMKDTIRESKILITASAFATVSKVVQELRFHLPGAFTAFHSVLSQDTGAFPTLKVLEMMIYDTDTEDRDVVTRWPCSISSIFLRTNARRRLNLHLSILPPSLTVLEGEWCKLVNPENVTFPESLTSLKMKLSRLTCDPVPLLPKGLRSLMLHLTATLDVDEGGSMPADERRMWAKETISKLPRGLTDLSWPVGEFTLNDLEALPGRLEYLSGGPILPAHFPLLPRSLRRSSPISFIGALTMEAVRNLPTDITDLRMEPRALPHWKPTSDVAVEVIGWCDDAMREELALTGTTVFPEHITSLNIFSSENLDCNMLPKRLTSLKFIVGAVDASFVYLLPKTLKVLSLASVDWLEDVETWKRLPPFLETLSVQVLRSSSPRFTAWIPPTITDLSITGGVTLSLDWFEALPKGLISLKASLALPPLSPDSTDSPWRIAIPTGLSCLVLETILPQTSKESSYAMRNILASLPPLLDKFTLISLECDNCVPYDVSVLLMLPKRLSFLSIPRNQSRDDSSLALILPRSLQIIRVGFAEFPR